MNEPLLPLKDCPFCGGEAKVIKYIPWHKQTLPRYHVACTTECCVNSRKFAHSEKEAIIHWNTRVTPPPAAIHIDLDAPLDEEAINKTKELLKELNAPKGEEDRCKIGVEKVTITPFEQPSEKKEYTLSCPKCDGAEITPDYLTAEEVNNVIEKYAIQYGYVKAPKNELCKYCKLPIAIRNPSGNCDHLYYPENVNKEFGSSGKRPLNVPEVLKVLENIETVYLPENYDCPGCNDIDWTKTDLNTAEAICKEFSTAEVSVFKFLVDNRSIWTDLEWQMIRLKWFKLEAKAELEGK